MWTVCRPAEGETYTQKGGMTDAACKSLCFFLCRLSTAACYNATNCEIMLESIVELQSLLLQNSSLLKHSALLSAFQSIVATTKEFLGNFSARSAQCDRLHFSRCSHCSSDNGMPTSTYLLSVIRAIQEQSNLEIDLSPPMQTA